MNHKWIAVIAGIKMCIRDRFCDLREGEAVPESYVMLRVKAGMQISVSPGKAHFVPISTNRSEPVKAAVVSPKMEALMVPLKERAEA